MAIDELLMKIAALLDAHGETAWAQSFHRFHSEYKNDPDATRGNIRAVYGGMGSFNDLILHGHDKIPLHDENNELDQLRSDLFQLCRRPASHGRK